MNAINLDGAPIAIIGLGYVGLPLAVEFGKIRPVLGFDVSRQRIAALASGHDSTLEVGSAELRDAHQLRFSSDAADLSACRIFIVTVPTPVDEARRPDLTSLIKASETVGRAMPEGAVVIYESTVYPGATEEVCVPVLEKLSGKVFNRDFYCGYSPERINPGDKEHRLPNICKVTSGSTPEVADAVDALYRQIVTAGTHKATSIRVAEAAKVIENTQRDLNIALMNELSLIFHRMGIDTLEVLEAAGSKWNFLPFRPGLVGGHCIGVDPYYLTHKAETIGHHPQVILAGRRINDSMGKYIGEQTIKQLIAADLPVKGADVVVLGLTFKENCPDLRNSKVIDVVRELQSYEVNVHVHDPMAESHEAMREYGVRLVGWDDLPSCHAIVAAVAHRHYKEIAAPVLAGKLVPNGVFVDVKSAFDRSALAALGLRVWRL